MSRDELLDKLAIELDSWPSSKLSAYQVPHKLPNSAKWARSGGRFCVSSLTNQSFQINKDHWLGRRTELINCPPDSEVPEWARWKAQDSNGWWHWFSESPVYPDNNLWLCGSDDVEVGIATFGKIPAGHDWRTTLSRINREDARYDSITGVKHRIETSTPEEEEEFARIQARQDAERPHEADARRLDALAGLRPHTAYNPASVAFKQPRYQDITGEDWIDEFARTKTVDEFRGAMSFNIGKYNRRVGKKDDVLKEVVKMRDYCERWEAYEKRVAE